MSCEFTSTLQGRCDHIRTLENNLFIDAVMKNGEIGLVNSFY